jgi:hypothetical protein
MMTVGDIREPIPNEKWYKPLRVMNVRNCVGREHERIKNVSSDKDRSHPFFGVRHAPSPHNKLFSVVLEPVSS